MHGFHRVIGRSPIPLLGGGRDEITYGDDAVRALVSSGDDALKIISGNLMDDMVDDWYGTATNVGDAAGNWDEVISEALAGYSETGYNGSAKGAGESGILNPPKPLSLSDIETRRWYLDAEAQISDLIDSTKPLEQQAMQASALRNQIRTQAREAMINRELANSLFGSRPNLTWDEVVKKYMDKGFVGDELYQEIIKAALRSNPSVNQYLGVFPK